MSRLPAPGTFISGYGTITRLDVSGQNVIASGSIDSSQIEPRWQMSSGAYGSGYIGKCIKCGKAVEGHIKSLTYIVPTSQSGQAPFNGVFCFPCAGFNLENRNFEGNKNKWIAEHLRDSAGFAEDTPHTIVADWYEDNGRSYDADWLRKHTSGL